MSGPVVAADDESQPERLAVAVCTTWGTVHALSLGLQAWAGERTPVAVLTPLGMLLVLPFLAQLGRALRVDRPEASLAVGYALMAPLLVLGGLVGGDDPVLTAQEHPGTIELTVVMWPLLLAGLGASAQHVASVLVRHRLAPASLRALAVGSWLIALPLLGGALVRTAQQPDIDLYRRQIHDLPVLARVGPVSGAPLFTLPARPGEPDIEVYADMAGGHRLERRCQGADCAVRRVPPDAEHPSLGGQPAGTLERRVARSEALRISGTPDGQVLVLETSGQQRFGFVGDQLRDVGVRDVGRYAAPPRGWLLGGLLGLGLAAVLTLRRLRIGELATPREPHPSHATRTPHDRLEERLSSLGRERAMSLDALIWAALALLCAPLVAAALLGLVF